MNTIKTLTVYLGSSGRTRPVFREAAETMGRIIGESGMKLVYGGMDAGLMGVLAKNAIEAGGYVTGIIPRKLKDIERELEGLSEAIIVEDLWDRKKRMFERADAVVALPGGYGTLDESLEVLYWASLGLHDKPLVLVNIEGYWDTILKYFETLPDFNAHFLIVVDKVEDVIPSLKQWPSNPDFRPNPGASLPHFEGEIVRKTNEPIIADKATLENSYYIICALGLKQLDKHQRPIGFYNKDGQFNSLLEWFAKAGEEKFVTSHCLELFDVDTDEDALHEKLRKQPDVHIDLHREKWGEKREKPGD